MNQRSIKSFAVVTVFAMALTMLSVGCARPPTEKPVYREARRAIEALDVFPEKAKVLAISKSELFIGKSAARADLLVKLDGGLEHSYTVHLKRVARTWVAQDAGPTPNSSTAAN
jgi:hypothetical protein|tara:strand:- start:272 stop:613 length:342 start_codon:yes stop_codon:yes gene_type:complete